MNDNNFLLQAPIEIAVAGIGPVFVDLIVMSGKTV